LFAAMTDMTRSTAFALFGSSNAFQSDSRESGGERPKSITFAFMIAATRSPPGRSSAALPYSDPAPCGSAQSGAKREKMRVREHSVNRLPSKPFRCEVVSETVTIALRRRAALDGNNQLFVRCSELDCQYIDTNEPPCPLTLDLFADEVRERQRRREETR
jgi:hypothetical protein